MKNRDDFIKVVQANEAIIYKITKVYTTDSEDQKDLYQEVVFQLWKSFESFRGESGIGTWIYRVALNTAISHLNKEKKKGNHFSMDDGILEKFEPQDQTLEEQTKVLYAHIKELGIVEKGLVLLYLEGKSYDEIAEITGFSISNVGTRLSRIKQKLKTQVSKKQELWN
ncbi:sigma-70 family RNA polymerase sigma factor [Flammeovirgaceae bacterium SG7u.111]|nr:sigma-70 family RNA polymerase sigma factor [Flammeovirgaceae bacterium SG7u.132]WPO34005.1 sigma-70 family RNA polymerase sigma factor [Flammeovirgaceae bacterium SG7u.111]